MRPAALVLALLLLPLGPVPAAVPALAGAEPSPRLETRSKHEPPRVRPLRLSPGDSLKVRYRGLNGPGKVRTIMRNRDGARVRIATSRVTRDRYLLTVPGRAQKLLRTSGGEAAPTRVRLRLRAGVVKSPWTRPKRSPRLLPPVVAPGNPPSQTPSDRALLRADGIRYEGSFRMPTFACGWTTAWSSAGLALRHVDGRVRLLTGAHVYGGSPIYEVGLPGVAATPAQWPLATVAQEHCDAYQDRRRLAPDTEPAGADVWTHGLHFDEAANRLYWSYGDVYNADASNDSVMGYTDFGSGQAYGPFGSGSDVHSQRIRGGVLRVPDWYAARYLNGHQLLIGFGGYYNIIGPGSMGPTLFTTSMAGAALSPQPLLDHPAAVTLSDHWALRPANYSIRAGLDWGRAPDGERGYWAPGDTIEGAAVWIDTGRKHALMYFTQLNLEEIWYGDGGLHSGGTASYWYTYDPFDLAEVAAGSAEAWEPQPQVTAVDYPSLAASSEEGAESRISGAAYDSATSRLFLLHLNAWEQDGEFHPVVHVYHVG